MTIGHLLETFDDNRLLHPPSASVDETRADHELDIYERGYQAGWDDCVKAQSGAAAALEEDFAQNLRELSFTYHEANTAAVNSLTPLIFGLIDTLFPELAHLALGEKLTKELQSLARKSVDGSVMIRCSPEKLRFLESMQPEVSGLDLCFSADDTLGEGQVSLSFGDCEREIDLDSFATELSTLTRAFLSDMTQETADV
ncbi:MAG: hypothetical protein FKY71_01325 [Spiribacter salinus]|uniref:Uncharacterized protein n=1 Tax=Spiribacter salinus TaxID=1335746 RepID=A0A540VVN7_9GAMM|nr:MAG: hypothetical protein FKY71_01325 [Spiribacter salinus]